MMFKNIVTDNSVILVNEDAFISQWIDSPY